MHLCADLSVARGEVHLIWRIITHPSVKQSVFQKKLQTFTEVLRSVKGGFLYEKRGMGESGREIKD